MGEDYCDEFMDKLKEFDSLIRYAAHRCRIPGVLDPEDLYQEGLLILDRMFHDDYEYYLETDVDFRKMFKTELWHGLIKIINKHKAKRRDFKKVLNEDYIDIERKVQMREEGAPAVEAFQGNYDPEQAFFVKEEADQVELFMDKLVERLDDDANVVLQELMYPTDWEDIPEVFKWTATDGVYERMPKRVPLHIIAELLGWPHIKVRRAVKRIRKASQELAPEMGFDLIAIAAAKR